jgi:hypothetical protein
MTKLIFKAVVLLVMVVALIPSPVEKVSFGASTKAPEAFACEPQSCKSQCIQLGYGSGLCGLNGRCECIGHPVE